MQALRGHAGRMPERTSGPYHGDVECLTRLQDGEERTQRTLARLGPGSRGVDGTERGLGERTGGGGRGWAA